ncbi:MAG: helix-turn-helix domain-containing protein [Fuerstiella sp.]|jgi:predicted transcriptional regulator
MTIEQTISRRASELQISKVHLARLAGVSRATLDRLLSGGHVTTATLSAVADVLGLQVKIQVLPRITVKEVKRSFAARKADRLAAMVQGTSALEAQGVDAETLDDIKEQAYHELLAGPPRRLWG